MIGDITKYMYLNFAGGETVAREDIMEAIERAKFGINENKLRPSTISKELEKIFPWMPSFMGRNDRTQDDLKGPLGYQALSWRMCLTFALTSWGFLGLVVNDKFWYLITVLNF